MWQLLNSQTRARPLPHLLPLRPGAGVPVEEGGGGPVHGLLRDAALLHRALHRGLARRNIQDCKKKFENF